MKHKGLCLVCAGLHGVRSAVQQQRPVQAVNGGVNLAFYAGFTHERAELQGKKSRGCIYAARAGLVHPLVQNCLRGAGRRILHREEKRNVETACVLGPPDTKSVVESTPRSFAGPPIESVSQMP